MRRDPGFSRQRRRRHRPARRRTHRPGALAPVPDALIEGGDAVAHADEETVRARPDHQAVRNDRLGRQGARDDVAIAQYKAVAGSACRVEHRHKWLASPAKLVELSDHDPRGLGVRLDAGVVGDHAGRFAHRSKEPSAGVLKAPESRLIQGRPSGFQHHLDDAEVFKVSRRRRAPRAACSMRAPRAKASDRKINGVTCHPEQSPQKRDGALGLAKRRRKHV